MSIVLLTSSLAPTGGIQSYNRNLLKTIREIGVEIQPIEIQGKNSVAKAWKAAIVLTRIIWNRPAHIICAHVNFSPLGYIVKKIANIPYTVLTHGIEVWDIKNNAQRKALLHAKVIATVSKFTAHKLIQQLPQIEKKIIVVPNSVDPNVFYCKEKPKEIRAKHGLTSEDVVMLTVCRFAASEQYKGYDQVLQALPEITKAIPRIKYLLVGSGDDIPRVQQLINSLHIENRVIFAGRVPEHILVDYYNAADVFVMPSKGEGFGIVFLEALACGKPVVAGNVDASREPLLNGELGLLVNPDSPAEIADAVITIIKETPSAFCDKNVLRKKILDVFGPEAFKERVNVLLKAL